MEELMSKIAEAYCEKYGQEAQFEEGETQVFEMNDCTVVVSKVEDGGLKIQLTGDKPIRVDYTTGFYENSEV